MWRRLNFYRFVPGLLLFAVFTTGSQVASAQDADGPAEEQISPFKDIETIGTAPVEPPANPATGSFVLEGGTIWTANGAVIAAGYVVVRDGRITEVGDGKPTAIDGLPVVTLTENEIITPGLIDTHSHLGVYPSPGGRAHSDGNEATAPTRGNVWAEHSFWPQDPGIQRAIAGGVTTLQALPGSANLVGGRGITLHLVPHRGARAMRFPDAPETLKMACGENPKRVYGDRGGPSTRMGNVAWRREAFIKAQRYLDEWRDYQESLDEWRQTTDSIETQVRKKKKKRSESSDEEPKPPKRDLEMETLAGLLEGTVLAQVHCYRADDMINVLQVADEFGFHVRSFHHALESYKIRDILAAYEVASSTWADWWGFKLEAYDGIPHNAALLTEAGARAIIHSDSPEGIQRLNQEAAKAMSWGNRSGIHISEDDALKWITLNAAWALGIDDQVGTVEVGKRADLVVWSGNPFSVYTHARLVFIDGLLRYDHSNPGPVWSDFEVGQDLVLDDPMMSVTGGAQ